MGKVCSSITTCWQHHTSAPSPSIVKRASSASVGCKIFSTIPGWMSRRAVLLDSLAALIKSSSRTTLRIMLASPNAATHRLRLKYHVRSYYPPVRAADWADRVSAASSFAKIHWSCQRRHAQATERMTSRAKKWDRQDIVATEMQHLTPESGVRHM